MRIINLVDRLDRVNYGIWNAAIATVDELRNQFGVDSEIWFPEKTNQADQGELKGAFPRGLQALDKGGFAKMAKMAGLNPSNDIIVSHGCWQYPTRWGVLLSKAGFKWVAVPHGMLEPWSIQQKKLRKWIYYQVFEQRALSRAGRIRAVGQPEFESLKERFGEQVLWIPNGVDDTVGDRALDKDSSVRTVLFMARLHHKKGILQLVEGWKASELCDNPNWRLRIAGPDDGELDNLQAFLSQNPGIRNIQYIGAVYGEEKERELRESHFYILPSFSEGFPTSVLEAMLYGLIPLVSKGCNFPEIFGQQLGIQVEPEIPQVSKGLNTIRAMSEDTYNEKSANAVQYIRAHYTNARLARIQMSLYESMMQNNGK